MLNFSQITEAVFKVAFYQKGNLVGWLEHPKLKQPIKLQNLSELILSLNDLMEQDTAVTKYTETKHCAESKNEVLTILRIHILFREHYTWQGCVFGEEQEIKIPFRSVLELIRILDELLA